MILLFEGNAGWRRIIADFLKQNGYEIILFDKLKTAQTAFYDKKSQIDIVICGGGFPRQEKEDYLMGLWAKELFLSKVKILVISRNVIPMIGISFIDKNRFREDILKNSVEELLNTKQVISID
jgi:hypothetical protein